MAIPYPEGEVLFKRSVLNHSSGFDADKESSFYGHALVESVWNVWVRAGNPVNTSGMSHPRTNFKVINPDAWNTDYGVFDAQKFTFSSDAAAKDRDHLRGVRLGNNLNANECRDREDGGPREVCLMPVKLGSEKYMFMDMTTPVRAIYFPLAYQCDEAFPDICSYLMIDFRLRDKIKFHHRSQSRWEEIDCDVNVGLGTSHWGCVLGFDLEGVYRYLSLPHQIRNPDMGLYKATKDGDEVVWFDNGYVIENYYSSNEENVGFDRQMDLAAVVSANLGVELVWAPYEFNNWAASLFKSLVEFGLGFIPVVGPLLSIEFSIAITAITDPEFFKSDNVLELPFDVLNAILDSGGKSKKYTTPGMHFTSSGSSEASEVTQKGAARQTRIKALRQKAEEVGWRPSGVFTDRLRGLEVGERVAVDAPSPAIVKSMGPTSGTVGQSAAQGGQSSTSVKLEVLCENLQMKEHTLKFH